MIIAFLTFIMLILILMGIYIFKRINKLSILNKINNKYLLIIIKILPILLLLIFLYIDMINTIVVYVHFFFFLLILDSIILIIKKISKKNINNSISFIIVLIFTILYLGYGYYLVHHVVETDYIIETTKDIGVDNFRIVQVTDSHIGATLNGDDFIKYMDKINKLNPDIVVITGDFVDDDTSYQDMVKGCIGLGNLKTKYGVYFVYGNHDKGYYNYRGYTDKELREELTKNNVTILEDENIEILDNIILVGRQDAQTFNRLSIKELTKKIDKDKYIIVLDHQPNDYKNEAKEDIDLVLSGHTHGGQLLPLGPFGIMIGAINNYYGITTKNNTTFIVSSGISDWAIKFKTGTISEYVVIDIKNK